MTEASDGISLLYGYGYYAGILYGVLLDDFGVSWRPYIDRNTDLRLMLQEAVGITEMISLDEIDLEPYGYSEISERFRNH